MKGFFIFYSAIILCVFCLLGGTLDFVTDSVLINNVETVKVSVEGAVEYEGDFTVTSNTYVIEVLRMAGISYNAVLDDINLYEFVTNKSTIKVPFGVININTAELKELMELDGVGISYAGKIITYRELTPFRNITDLMNISNSIYEKNHTRITV